MPLDLQIIGSPNHGVFLALASAPRSEAEALHQRHVLLCAGWFFLVVTLILAASILKPNWRKHWRWGTMKTGTPMTAVGRIAWIFAFAICSAASFSRGLGGDSPIVLILMVAAFAFLLVAAWYDTWHFRRVSGERKIAPTPGP